MGDFEMTADTLLSAMIAFYMEQGRENHVYDNGQWDMLLHMTQVVRGLSRGEAAEWLAEECQDRLTAMAD